MKGPEDEMKERKEDEVGTTVETLTSLRGPYVGLSPKNVNDKGG